MTTKTVILPILPILHCPDCLCKLTADTISSETTAIYLHWVGDCKRSGQRFEVVIDTRSGFPVTPDKNHSYKKWSKAKVRK